MSKHVLITGGAGFIGSHVADRLLAKGYRVRALDNLSPQVHGEQRQRPDYLDPEVDLIIGDIRDPDTVKQALEGIDAVFHFAAKVGVGQSMYEVADYLNTNITATGVLLEALMRHPVDRLVMASSMSIYGEGMYRTDDGRLVEGSRKNGDLQKGDWQAYGPEGEPLSPVPTTEDKAPSIASIYAMSKLDQERMSLMLGETYGIPTTALRFFNVYGERQALSNPYTGVLAIFASRLLNGNPPQIFEDGHQRRDFVSVHDVADACALALERDEAVGRAFNIGSGHDVTVTEVAQRVAAALGRDIEPLVTGKYRTGDIRNCFADISLAQEQLGFEPKIRLDAGIRSLSAWLEDQNAEDRVAEATRELTVRGLAL
ncbi:NAD-dependent epimerase/dehydratase family protein [Thiohalomonas denitrificans]|uniref:dTDP-L-rhamnose 4-epimerase n=1 Tax=Thiohalomonas denitrificans TaxID=415747 RepID=A0A1G5Q2T5_9GAMM|nr:SDR family NAD(P)-dependent oxidoreductase [Thiohalomonas denitrificans]SCZ56205.1 dTDP-L-rhamnose 4-epimerase [Thiohalomonas denitrificans]